MASAVKETTNNGGRKPPVQLYKAGIWICPRCKNTVEIFVKMTAPPSCNNHIGKGITVMELKGK
jgi:ribosomal protein L37AE/L43A